LKTNKPRDYKVRNWLPHEAKKYEALWKKETLSIRKSMIRILDQQRSFDFVFLFCIFR